MGVIRSHSHHRGVKLLVEQKVIGQVFRRLERQADHCARAGLVADSLQVVKRLQATVVGVQGVVGMNLAVKVRIAGLYTQQIAMRAGIEPFLINLTRLLAQRKGNPQRRILPGIDGLDSLQQAGDLADKS